MLPTCERSFVGIALLLTVCLPFIAAMVNWKRTQSK